MKLPVPCLRCKTYTMEMDMALDHQHIKCASCGALWCLHCTHLEIDAEWLESLPVRHQPGTEARLN